MRDGQLGLGRFIDGKSADEAPAPGMSTLFTRST